MPMGWQKSPRSQGRSSICTWVLCALLLQSLGCSLAPDWRRDQAGASIQSDTSKDGSKSRLANFLRPIRGGVPGKYRTVGSSTLKASFLKRREPSNYRNWRPDLAILPFADIGSDRIKLYHVRDCEYRTEEDYDVRHFDLDFPLQDVRTLDFIVVPFQNSPALAHTMLSFGLANGQYLVVSVEGRLEQGEAYSALGGSFDGFELTVVIGTERDLIRLRTEVRKVDVYLYPIAVPPEQAQRLFVAMLGRANSLARTPEFYDTISNNCTTNIVKHINGLKPGSIPNDVRILLPGHSDRLAYDLGLIATNAPFELVQANARVNTLAHLHADSPDFSQRIRGR